MKPKASFVGKLSSYKSSSWPQTQRDKRFHEQNKDCTRALYILLYFSVVFHKSTTWNNLNLRFLTILITMGNFFQLTADLLCVLRSIDLAVNKFHINRGCSNKEVGHFRVLLCLCFKTSLKRNLSYENEFYVQFHFHANQNHVQNNGFAVRLALKRRHKGTQKWSNFLANTWITSPSHFANS